MTWADALQRTPAWLAMLLVAAAPASAAMQEAARRAGGAFGWREKDESEGTDTRASPYSLGSAFAGWALTCLSAAAHPADPVASCACAAGTGIAWYAAEVDRRERWLPDHALLPFLLTGFLLTPYADPQSRIAGFCANVAAMCAWSLCAALLRRRRLDWESLHGGDMLLASGIGAWLGQGDGEAALGLAVALALAASAGMKADRPQGRTRYERALNYDPADRTAPVGPYLVLAFVATSLGRAIMG